MIKKIVKKRKLRTSAEESISLLTISPVMVQTTVLSKEGHTMSRKTGESSSFYVARLRDTVLFSFIFF